MFPFEFRIVKWSYFKIHISFSDFVSFNRNMILVIFSIVQHSHHFTALLQSFYKFLPLAFKHSFNPVFNNCQVHLSMSTFLSRVKAFQSLLGSIYVLFIVEGCKVAFSCLHSHNRWFKFDIFALIKIQHCFTAKFRVNKLLWKFSWFTVVWLTPYLFIEWHDIGWRPSKFGTEIWYNMAYYVRVVRVHQLLFRIT